MDRARTAHFRARRRARSRRCGNPASVRDFDVEVGELPAQARNLGQALVVVVSELGHQPVAGIVRSWWLAVAAKWPPLTSWPPWKMPKSTFLVVALYSME